MKRISFWFLSTVSVVVLLVGYDASQGSTTTSAQSSFTSGTVAGGTASASSSPAASDPAVPSASPSTQRSGGGSSASAGTSPTASSTPKVTTSTVTGSVINTQWGPVQVQLAITGGKITKVSVLRYPNGNSRDIEIAKNSLPVLIQETLGKQSAKIDMVSGATYTSTGYIRSLQSALDQTNL